MTPTEVVLLAVAAFSQIIAYLALRQSRRLIDHQRNGEASVWRRSNARWRERAIKSETMLKRLTGQPRETRIYHGGDPPTAIMDYVSYPEQEPE